MALIATSRMSSRPACDTVLMANAIRALAMDAVQQVESGHPGAPMGLAELARDDIAVRVVSMPSTSVFDRQAIDDKSSVLPPRVPRVAIEAGVIVFRWQYGCAAAVGIDCHEEGAPAGNLFEYCPITTHNLADTVRAVLRAR